jgi:uncharacterized protein with HEPN domain
MRDERTFLWDMVKRANMALRFIGGKSREEFLADPVTQEAVIRQLAIIGEAAKKVRPERGPSCRSCRSGEWPGCETS